MSIQRRLYVASALAILVALVAINPFGRNLVDVPPMPSIVDDVH